jgi:hypothetical protein
MKAQVMDREAARREKDDTPVGDDVPSGNDEKGRQASPASGGSSGSLGTPAPDQEAIKAEFVRVTTRFRSIWSMAATVVVVLSGALDGWLLEFRQADPEDAWLTAVVAMTIVMALIGKAYTGRVTGLLIDWRNRMSLSRLQLALWTILVSTSVLVSCLFNLQEENYEEALNIGIDYHLIIILVLAASSNLLSQRLIWLRLERHGATVLRRQSQPGALDGPEDTWTATNMVLRNRDLSDADWSDLVRSDNANDQNRIDIAKAQFLLVTLVFVGIYAIGFWDMFRAGELESQILHSPRIAGSLLFLFVVSHILYIGSKFDHSSPRVIAPEEQPQPYVADTHPLPKYTERDHQRPFSLYTIYRNYVVHEDGLIHQRTSWLMTFQSVLLGAFAFVFEGHIGKQDFESWFDTSGPTIYYRGFLLFLCVAGIGAAAISLHSITAASRAIRELHNG